MNQIKIAVIGLGYVGLPLARLFSTKFSTIGFDLNQSRVDALMTGHDATHSDIILVMGGQNYKKGDQGIICPGRLLP